MKPSDDQIRQAIRHYNTDIRNRRTTTTRVPGEVLLKIKALLQLKDYDFDYQRVGEQLKVKPSALKKWVKEMGDQVYTMDESIVSTYSKEMQAAVLTKRAELIAERSTEIAMMSIQVDLIEQIKQLLPKEKHMGNVSNALRAVTEALYRERMARGEEGKDPEGTPKQKNQQNNILSQYIETVMLNIQNDPSWKQKIQSPENE